MNNFYKLLLITCTLFITWCGPMTDSTSLTQEDNDVTQNIKVTGDNWAVKQIKWKLVKSTTTSIRLNPSDSSWWFSSSKIFKHDQAWFTFVYPLTWFIDEEVGKLAIKNYKWDFDKTNQPEDFKIFWIYYNIADSEMASMELIKTSLENSSDQYMDIKKEVIDIDSTSIDLYTYSDVDCWKSAKAFWSVDWKLQYAFRWWHCWNPMNDDEYDSFKDILLTILYET